MSKLGTFVIVDVDPETNGGFDAAPALVVGEHEDGSLAVRVFAASGSTGDTVRNYVDDNGDPFDYGDQAPAPAPTSRRSAAASTPVTSGGMGVPQQVAAVPTIDQLRDMTPDERAQLAAELAQLDDAQAPTTDGQPGGTGTGA